LNEIIKHVAKKYTDCQNLLNYLGCTSRLSYTLQAYTILIK